MSKLGTEPFIALDFDDPREARSMAQEIADNIGREIIVTDKDGNEVCSAHPRRNQLMVLPETRH